MGGMAVGERGQSVQLMVEAREDRVGQAVGQSGCEHCFGMPHQPPLQVRRDFHDRAPLFERGVGVAGHRRAAIARQQPPVGGVGGDRRVDLVGDQPGQFGVQRGLVAQVGTVGLEPDPSVRHGDDQLRRPRADPRLLG